MQLIVNFGSTKAGLSTVGYRLITSTGTIGSRITAGVTEVVSGIYKAAVTVVDGFVGIIKWDTGEVTPVYAVEEINPITATASIGSSDITEIVTSIKASLTASTVTVASPVASTGQIVIYQHDDYDADEARAITFSDSGNWLNLTGASVSLICKSRGGITITLSGTVLNPGTASQSVSFEIPRATFGGVTKDDPVFTYFAVVSANAHNQTLAAGRLLVVVQSFLS